MEHSSRFCVPGNRCEGCPAANAPEDVRAGIDGAVAKLLQREENMRVHSAVTITAAVFSLKSAGIEKPSSAQIRSVAAAASKIATGDCTAHMVEQHDT